MQDNTVIYARYEASAAIDIDKVCADFNVKKENIKYLHIRWDELHLTMDNGDIITHCIDYALNDNANYTKFPDEIYWEDGSSIDYRTAEAVFPFREDVYKEVAQEENNDERTG